jgi:hypothetical protein
MKLNRATQMLFIVASGHPLLCREMGIKEVARDTPPPSSLTEVKIELFPQPRPWLLVNGKGTQFEELAFEPDIFAKRLRTASSGERHAILFLLNVWNPGYAKSKRWNFNLFDAMGTLDTANIEPITEWMLRPVWP